MAVVRLNPTVEAFIAFSVQILIDLPYESLRYRNMKNVTKLSENELRRGGTSSWHDQYKDSAWIFVGGLPYDLSEGDVICLFSQYGEIVNINLIRDKVTGKQKGFCFLCYEDQRSTVLAVDNLNGIKVRFNRIHLHFNRIKMCMLQVLGKSLRVDHVQDYKPPKDNDKYDDVTRQLHDEGCAPKLQIPPSQIKREQPEVVGGVQLPMRLPIRDVKHEKDIKVFQRFFEYSYIFHRFFM